MGEPTLQERIVHEKIQQVVPLLERYAIDLWLIFVRETTLTKDPALELIYPHELTWQSAFLFSRAQSTAIVGRYDLDSLSRLGAYDRLIGYDQSIRPGLQKALQDSGAERIAVNYSTSDPASDGLTVGMMRLLEEILAQAGIPTDRLQSAEDMLASLRGQKSPGEVEGIQAAIRTTESLYQEIGDRIRVGVTEIELADYLHRRMVELNLGYAWDPHANPIVNTGPESVIGHAAPSELAVEPGHLVHFDFGVKENGFCSDLQRMWYVLEPGQTAPPAEVTGTWNAVRGALLAGANALRPGAVGWQVDQAARQALVAGGLPEYQHAFGHHIGRVAHDGSTLLGPRWDRYGSTPEGVVETGNVFAIELGAEVPGRGWIYLEENLRVTEEGVEWLSRPQEEIWLVLPDST